ncbi:MAG: aldo/keto reductase, partial [Alphaproteobacteria bacterium]|nr:aldo/keto reductase [Alphaproteobacteria bacterium]
MNKLALGTVQFGMPYGIANNSGKIDFEEASDILNLAKLNDVNTLDTAIGYGDSEQVLGQIGTDDFQIITKLPAAPDNLRGYVGWVEDKVYQSLEKLKKNSLYGFLFHKPSQLLDKNGNELYKALDGFKSQGLIKNIG